ncbi:transketolase [Candidatus Nomurabacteria bacterium RIFCSPLOWO2_01_FULL_42_20]|uniref:Transketolase n=1 Tax=Candidatus Nomurabacteria bacterium RIFCSPHIGHO2_01_FULL_42_16 TaxID=1801743 RepID=A0A1F6VJ81_9BACT|nr:MAG: transketolase [Candidatus Nomurabacteria bacterium RIFCSPHIGHO2_01_FULL_42_16]OGI92571.1 MAG: transketolase [Candidatus Nomurabacteria bacterium RIFCSPLOWO2_01_FULL_42_20]HLA25863.1 transketolase [Patescibacteria group bacterium]
MRRLKEKIIEMSAKSKEGHIPSALSVLDLLWVLYDRVLNISPEGASSPDRDIFILSKGHASLGLYVVLAEKGFINSKSLDDFCKFKSDLGGHPDRTKISGVEASTGSLGHGLPMAVGAALGFKIKKQKNKVYVIVGDGECNEGTIWESALLASNHHLDNLCCIVDYNHSGDRALKLGNLEEKFKSFGWTAASVDGHDQEKIYQALMKKSLNRPVAIIARTIKGHGSKIMENNPVWHHKFPKGEELDMILKELN